MDFNNNCIILFVVLACINVIDAWVLRDSRSEITHGHLVAVHKTTGSQHRLHRDKVRDVVNNDDHHISLHLDDQSHPMEMKLTHASVWSKDSVLYVHRGSHSEALPQHSDYQCYIQGILKSSDGHISINFCGRLTGRIVVPGISMELNEIPSLSDKTITKLQVSRTFEPTSNNEDFDEDIIPEEELEVTDDIIEDFSSESEDGANRTRRGTDIEAITIEVSVFADANYLRYLGEKGYETNEKAKDWFITKWNGVQVVLMSGSVGFNITIQLKRIELWWQNPDNYVKNSVKETPRMNWVCQNTKRSDQSDVKILYTSKTGDHPLGMAYRNGACGTHRCFLAKGPRTTSFIELHELGHTLGLPHEPKIAPCKGVSPTGMMAWDWNTIYHSCYTSVLLRSLRPKECLFREDVSRNDPKLVSSLDSPEV